MMVCRELVGIVVFRGVVEIMVCTYRGVMGMMVCRGVVDMMM